MTDRTIINMREPGSDYFKLIYSKKFGRSSFKLQFHLDKFDINDYYIYKSSGRQREVSIEDLYEFKYSGYILFKKDKYDREEINSWIDFIILFGGIPYLNKPYPPNYIKDKINIIK